MLVVLVFVSALSAVAARTCTTVNGISGACNLPLNYFTLAGTHDSGAGAFGKLYYWNGLVAPSCFLRAQDKNITEQLNLGVRFFDFDLAHIESSSSEWWEPGLVLVSCTTSCAYSRSLLRAMSEIEAFLDENKDEIVVIRLKDHPEDSREYIKKNLRSELGRFISGQAKVKLNPYPNPRLGNAIEWNERLIIYANALYEQDRPIQTLDQIETDTGVGGTAYCYSEDGIVKDLTENDRINDDRNPVEVNWYQSYGLCLWDLADLCDDDEFNKLVTINEEIVNATGRPINAILVDYVGAGSVRLADIVQEINEYNVEVFA